MVSREEIRETVESYLDCYVEHLKKQTQCSYEKIREEGVVPWDSSSNIAGDIIYYELGVERDDDEYEEILQIVEEEVEEYYPTARQEFYDALNLPPWVEVVEDWDHNEHCPVFWCEVDPDWFDENAECITEFTEGHGLSDSDFDYVHGAIYKYEDKFYKVYSAYGPNPVFCCSSRQWYVDEIDEEEVKEYADDDDDNSDDYDNEDDDEYYDEDDDDGDDDDYDDEDEDDDEEDDDDDDDNNDG